MFRATRIYTRLYEDASGAAALRDGLCQSLSVDQLAQAFLCAGEARPASWALLAIERRSLLRGDVPYFGGHTDDTSLLLEDGTSIAGYFAEPSYQAVLKKLSQLNEADLAFQIELDTQRTQPGVGGGGRSMTQGGEGEMDLSDIIRYAWRDAEFKQSLVRPRHAQRWRVFSVSPCHRISSSISMNKPPPSYTWFCRYLPKDSIRTDVYVCSINQRILLNISCQIESR